MTRLFVYFFVLLVGLSHCKSTQTGQTIDKPMTDLEPFLKDLEEFEKKGLWKSALEHVDNSFPQLIKSGTNDQIADIIMRGAGYNHYLEERGSVEYINWMQSKIQHVQGNARAITLSILAEQFELYFLQNAWRIRDRSHDPNFRPERIDLWSARHLLEYVDTLYQQSLVMEDPQEPLTEYPRIVIWDSQAKDYNPSVFYFLVDRYLQFLTKDHQINLAPTQPYVTQAEAIGELKDFLTWNIVETGKFHSTLRLFQSLIEYSSKNERDLLYVKTNLNRLEYAWSKSSHPNRKELFEKALENLLVAYTGKPVYPEVAYYVANYCMSFQNSEDQIEKKKYLSRALALVEEVIERSIYEDKHNCQILYDRIHRPDYDLTVEEVNIPDQPLRGSLRHKNISSVNFSLYSLSVDDWDLWSSLENREKPGWLNNQETYRNWSQPVKDEKDYLDHRVEIKFDPLPVGIYLLASEVEGLSQYIVFHVSQLAWMHRQGQNLTQVFVVDRMTGLPLSKVKLEFYTQDYNSRSRKRRWIKVKDGFTDNSGRFDLTGNENRSYRVKLVYQQDSLFLQDGVYERYGNRRYGTQSFTHMFTDRSIYRPGQIIQFKGIGIHKDEERNPSYVVNTPVTVELLDANHEVLKKLELRTNPYGSFHGQFAIPQGLLKGTYALRSSLGNSIHGVQVEEYKRPKFEVILDPLTESFVLDQEVVLKGAANSLVNTPLDDVGFKYTVTQLPVYLPYYGFFSRFYQQAPILIQQGSGFTDSVGQFEVRFTPDAKPGSEPGLFNRYNLLVEVTDKNGETRSVEKQYQFNQIGKFIDLNGPELFFPNDLMNFTIQYKNTNGSNLTGELQYTLEELVLPEISLRDRLWPAPDQWIISAEEFRAFFPLDPYREENQIEHYAVRETLRVSSLRWSDTSRFRLSDKLEPGAYKLSISDGDVSDDIFFNVLGREDNTSQYGLNIKAAVETQPGIGFNYRIHSYGHSENVLMEVMSRARNEIIWTHDGDKNLEFSEAERGGATIQAHQIVHNRYYSQAHPIDIPWTNKKLKVQTITFKNLLEPGEPQNWKVKVTDHQGRPVTGLVVSTMYDAALDYFAHHHWGADWYPYFINNIYTRSTGFGLGRSNIFGVYPKLQNPRIRGWFWLKSAVRGGLGRRAPVMRNMKLDEVNVMSTDMETARSAESALPEEAQQELSVEEDNAVKPIPQIRKNLNETVFFFPGIPLDSSGEASFDFTMNEALTSWKWKLFIHDRDVATGYHEEEIITRKEIMIFPNFPRIVREGDKVELPVKITNAGDEAQSVQASIEYFDPLSGDPLMVSWLGSDQKNLFLDPNSSGQVSWDIEVPRTFKSPIGYRVVAFSETHSDGEEGAIPVLTNQLFLTETIPITAKPEGIKTIDFNRFNDKLTNPTIDPFKLTIEITENPMWLVVKSLPFLLTDPHPNAISASHRLFANSIVKNIYDSHPEVGRIIRFWANEDGLESPLLQDEELKNILLQETPWVTDANEETAQMQLLAGLSNPNVLNNALSSVIQELLNFQKSDGGFSWSNGGTSNLYTTLYVLDVFRKLKQKSIGHPQTQQAITQIEQNAIPYIDREVLRIYDRTEDRQNQTVVSPLILRYLLVRQSLEAGRPYASGLEQAIEYYKNIAYEHWVEHGMGSQVQIGFLAHWDDQREVLQEIISSLIERAREDEILGTYWPVQIGYTWNNRPLEIQSHIIELFRLTGQREELIQSTKTWLLRNKQTQYWKASTAVSSAVYALLEPSTTMIPVSQRVTVTLGEQDITPKEVDEAGTGYWKRAFSPTEMNEYKGQLIVDNPNPHTVWGAAYFQYFQESDAVENFDRTPMKAQKEIYFTRADGQVVPLSRHQLEIGDRVRVVITIESDRTYEFVHLRDLRGAGLEPLKTRSEYRYQSGLGFYQSPSDMGMDFYFDYLPKGKYTLEYDAYVAQAGDYSMGLAKIQCLYAPEYASHTKGQRIKVHSGQLQ